MLGLSEPLTGNKAALAESFFAQMDEKNLREQVAGAQNEYAKIIRERFFEDRRIDLLFEEVLGYDMLPHHEEMVLAQEQTKPGGRHMNLAFRGSGKSTTCTVGRVVAEVLRNPDIRILVCSNTQIQAEIFLREIKEQFEANEKLRAIFGNYVGSKWDAREIIVPQRKRRAKESTVTCIGVGGPTASRHYDLIIADDIVDEENSRTELQRERLRIWWAKSLIPTLEPDGRLFINGTLWNPADLYNFLMETDKALKPTIIPAIKEDGTSTWPEKFPIDFLTQKRVELGTPVFESQYQQSTKAMTGKLFKWEWFKFYDIPPPDLRIFQGVDLAISQKETADYFAVATIGLDPATRRVYVLDIYRARLSFSKQTQTIGRLFYRFDPVATGIEANAYQAAQLSNVKTDFPDVRVRAIYTTKDKVTRAMKLSARVEAGEFFFLRDQMELLQELLAMPDSDHDDMFDALDIAVQTSIRGARKQRTEEPGII